MNAIAKAVPQGVAVDKLWLVAFPQAWLYTISLIFVVLLSALALVYVKDLNRRLFINYQEQQQVDQQLISYHNKLLLENGAWSSQDRIQAIAESQLEMKTPGAKDIIIVKYN